MIRMTDTVPFRIRVVTYVAFSSEFVPSGKCFRNIEYCLLFTVQTTTWFHVTGIQDFRDKTRTLGCTETLTPFN